MPADTPWDYDEDDTEALAQDGPWASDVMDTSNPSDVRYSGPMGAFTRFSDNILRAMAHGATSGADNAIAAGVEGLTGGKNNTLEAQRGVMGQVEEELGTPGYTAANLVGSLGGGIAIPGGAVNSVGKALGTGLAAGAAATTSQAYFDTGELPSVPQVIVGSLLSGGMSTLGYGLGKTMQRPKLAPRVQKDTELLAKEGIDLTVGQATKNPATLAKEATASGAFEFNQNQTKAFSQAALRRANLYSDDGTIDPETVNKSLRWIGGQMDQLAQNNNMRYMIDKNGRFPILDEMRDVMVKYADRVEGGEAKILQKTFQKVAEGARKGEMSGQQWQEITSDLFEASKGSSSNLADATRRVRKILMDNMEKSIQTFNPADAGAWAAANRLYANNLVIQEAIAAGGPQAAGGMITPQTLRQAAISIRGKKLYAKGATDFDDLSRAGMSLIKPLPIGGSATPHEIVRVLAKRVARDAMGAGAGFALGTATGMGPLAGAALGGAAVEGIGHQLGRARLKPVMARNPNAGAIGAQIGTGTGMAVNTNPFSRAKEQE